MCKNTVQTQNYGSRALDYDNRAIVYGVNDSYDETNRFQLLILQKTKIVFDMLWGDAAVFLCALLCCPTSSVFLDCLYLVNTWI